MNLEIITPEKTLFEGEADCVVVPALDGELGILNNHAPIIAALKAGAVKITNEGQTQEFQIVGGVLEVKNSRVMILAE